MKRHLRLGTCVGGMLSLAVSVGSEPPDRVVARVAGNVVRASTLERIVADFMLRTGAGDDVARRQVLDSLIDARVLEWGAHWAGKPIDEFLEAELSRRTAEVTPEDARGYYEEHREQFDAFTEEEALDQITQTLRANRRRWARDKLMEHLRGQAGVEVLLPSR